MLYLHLCLREKLAECQSKLLEQATQHQAKEASLLDQLHDAQQQQRDSAEMCKGVESAFYHFLKCSKFKHL